MYRFYLPEEDIISGGEYVLPPEEGHHLARVLRISTGERVAVFDGKGNEFLAEVGAVKGKEVKVKILTRQPPRTPELSRTIHLGIPITERVKLEFIAEKSTELGVSAMYLYSSARSHSHIPVAEINPQKLMRLRKKVIGAAKQCGRAFIPTIVTNLKLEELLKRFSASKHCLRIFPWEKCEHPLLSEFLREINPLKFTDVALIIGPEGGFTYEEARIASDTGFQLCSLGRSILRMETAVIVSLSLILAGFYEI